MPRKSNKISVRPRFWLILMMLILVLSMPLYIKLHNQQKKLNDAYAEQVAYRDQLKEQVLDLQKDISYLKSEEGIERYARAAGMVMPGEIQFVAGGANK
ncbi:MAG: septum formation initiator family protein [Clostridia bacterium]|nr:septum formation initiator family protein [Clostridia bacterium]